ncbi:MAG: type 4a pilus biogenesis protein PilO [Candidatus Omnitrophota bacterium]
MKIKISNRVPRIIVFIFIISGVWLVSYLLVGRPVIKYFSRLKVEFGQKQVKLQESQDLVRSLPNPQKAIEEIRGVQKEFQDSAVNAKNIPRLLQLLNQSAGERGIRILSLRPREDIKNENNELPEGISKIYLEVAVVCEYRELAEYVKADGGLPPDIKVESMTVEKNMGEEDISDVKSAPRKSAGAPGLLKAVLILSVVSG